MHDIQDLVRLHRLEWSDREIARQLGMGQETVRRYMGVLGGEGLLDG